MRLAHATIAAASHGINRVKKNVFHGAGAADIHRNGDGDLVKQAVWSPIKQNRTVEKKVNAIFLLLEPWVYTSTPGAVVASVASAVASTGDLPP